MAADKLDNARSLLREYRVRGESLWNFFHGGRDGTLWYYGAMLAALKDAGVTPLVEELERTLAEIRRIADEEQRNPKFDDLKSDWPKPCAFDLSSFVIRHSYHAHRLARTEPREHGPTRGGRSSSSPALVPGGVRRCF